MSTNALVHMPTHLHVLDTQGHTIYALLHTTTHVTCLDCATTPPYIVHNSTLKKCLHTVFLKLLKFYQTYKVEPCSICSRCTYTYSHKIACFYDAQFPRNSNVFAENMKLYPTCLFATSVEVQNQNGLPLSELINLELK